jgi:hypothetical protein
MLQREATDVTTALGRPVSYFVEEDVGQDDVAVLTPPDEDRPVYTSHQGIELNSISGPYGRFLLAGARACVVPGASSGRKPMQHPGEELVYLLMHPLELRINPLLVLLSQLAHRGISVRLLQGLTFVGYRYIARSLVAS